MQTSRFGQWALLAAPTLGAILLSVLPLVLGTGTLVYRDALTTHRPMTEALARGLETDGQVPLIDPQRAGGQALAGNPNAVAVHPSRLLHLVAPPLWTQNAHVWIHWLLAPWAGWWMGRSWRLGRIGSWGVGVTWATSGFLLSQLNLLNLVAGIALAPALVAAARPVGARPLRRRALLGVLWALALLGGDPIVAVLALAAALAASGPLVPSTGRRLRDGLALAAAVAAGTLLAAPMLLETLRILPGSYRGHWQLSPRAILAQSWDPRSALEIFFPLIHGRPDLGFWGYAVHGGNPPLFSSLSFGPLALALVLVGLGASVPSRARRWSLTMIAGGLFLAAGAWNPLVRLALELPGAGLLRYPVKAWLLVALGSSLLAGLGLQRVTRDGVRPLALLLGLFAVGYLAAWQLVLQRGSEWMEAVLRSAAGRAPRDLLLAEPGRWAAIAFTCGLLCLLGLAALGLRRRPALAAGLLLALQAFGQTVLLGPLVEIDAREPYLAPPPLLAGLEPGNLVAHGGLQGLFGAGAGEGLAVPSSERGTAWLTRWHAAQAYPASGAAWGVRYAFNPSTEGLDAFATVALTQALPLLPDDLRRVRLLRASGVDRLILDRPLDGTVDLGPPLAAVDGPSGTTGVWRLGPVRPAWLATTLRPAPHLDAALATLTSADFDPAADVVVAGEGPLQRRPPGTAEVLFETADRLDVEVRSDAGGVLVTRRTRTPLWRARIDGRPAPTRMVNGHLLGLDVPPGVRRVRLEVDRTPWRRGVALAVAGAVVLLAMADPERGRRRDEGP